MPIIGFMVLRAQPWIWGGTRWEGISQKVGQVCPDLLSGLGALGRHPIMATQAPLYSPLPSPPQ